ncbi:uncharacterized protein LOC112957638 isoform X2 [Nothoprocta perdicaria]|uniref:uncharacterized protein LOC112957638 isoform X2 n=1 Tax=Nothoprocta perdicaria TaxID=30464 RepID=UPI000E1BBC7C|nr:uncharacterized protein LOC112957638 isoform X2 [Nothoprocta perdicaria]
MDSLPCIGLCLLLGTISSPFLTTALLTGDPAKKTPRSSVGSTKVTVYNCRRCGLTVCELSNFSCCTIIGETQDKTFSNEVIQLVTSEARITMCFQQADAFPEGIYAIIWAKDEGIGESCGMLKAEASPENRPDAVVMEWKTCCTTEIELAVSSSPLNCSSLPIFADENSIYSASPSISRQGTSGITATFTVLVVCAVAVAAFFVLKKQKCKGGAAAPEMENSNTV